MRGSYLHHKQIKAAQGVKIAAPGLEHAVAGTQMLIVGPDDDVDALKDEAMEDMQDIFSSVDRSGGNLGLCCLLVLHAALTAAALWRTSVAQHTAWVRVATAWVAMDEAGS